MGTLKISIEINKNGEKYAGTIEGSYDDARRFLDELFSKTEGKNIAQAMNYTEAQQKILELRDNGYLDTGRSTKDLLQELKIKFGIIITPNNAPKVLLPLLKAKEVDRQFVKPNPKLPKGAYVWFKSGVKLTQQA